MSKETLEEKIWNIIISSIGILLSIPMLVLLIINASNSINILTSVLYATMIFYTFLMNCIINSLKFNSNKQENRKKRAFLNGIWLHLALWIVLILGMINKEIKWFLVTILLSLFPTIIVICQNEIDKHKKICAWTVISIDWLIGTILYILNVFPNRNAILTWCLGELLYTTFYILQIHFQKKKFITTLSLYFLLISSIIHFLFIMIYFI